MHTINRILTCLVIGAILVPSGMGFAVVSIQQKEDMKEELQHVIEDAVTHYRQRSGVQGLKGKNEVIKATQEQKIVSFMQQKRELRLQIAKQKRIIAKVGERYGRVLTSKEQLQLLIGAQKERVMREVREEYTRRTQLADGGSRVAVIDALFGINDTSDTVERTQMKVLGDLVAAEKAFWKLEALEKQREETLTSYWELEKSYQKTVKTVERTAAELEQIKKITAEVHDQVLKLQSELARIDAKLKAKAERTLIEKGLIDAASSDDDNSAYRPLFTWPAYGRVSAGFHNDSYKQYFGVAHEGADIVVGQGTPIVSAADGVVFFVRDGGETGYTYILIGHRGGYATLYGHLSETSVTAGQDVSAGDVIGLSGGQPGTRGAGPMTTAPHLHFEVILAGANIDPLTVLP